MRRQAAGRAPVLWGPAVTRHGTSYSQPLHNWEVSLSTARVPDDSGAQKLIYIYFLFFCKLMARVSSQRDATAA